MSGESRGPFKVEALWDRGYIKAAHFGVRVPEVLAYSLKTPALHRVGSSGVG